MQPYVVILCIL